MTHPAHFRYKYVGNENLFKCYWPSLVVEVTSAFEAREIIDAAICICCDTNSTNASSVGSPERLLYSKKLLKKHFSIRRNYCKNQADDMMKSSVALLFIIFVCTAQHCTASPQNRSGRYRRTVGQRTRCVSKLTPFCKMFTHGKVVEKFCLFVLVKHCTALD